MNVLLLTAVVLAAALSASRAAQRREVHVILEKKEDSAESLDSLVTLVSLDPRNGFKFGEEARTAKGISRRRIRQTYGGLDVVGANADVAVTTAGVVVGSVVGSLAFSLETDIPDPSACNRSESELFHKCQSVLRAKGVAMDGIAVENFRMVKKVDFEGPDTPARLVYEVDFFLAMASTPSRPFFQLDACDPHLAVIRQFDKISNSRTAWRERREEEKSDIHPRYPRSSPTGPCPSSAPAQGVGGNPKTGKITYGQNQPYCLHTKVSGTRCIMDTRHARVIDMKKNSSSPVEFECADGYSDPKNGAFGVANDAFYYGYSVGLVYEDWYGFRALGRVPTFRVHYGDCYHGANFDGMNFNFGDGCNQQRPPDFHRYPFVSLDVLAHELGHGITEMYSALNYEKQSGGINEAFSDMSGEVAKLFTHGKNDWQSGYDIVKGNKAIRYYDRPSRDGFSIDSVKDYRDGMNVHYSSGVFNRAFHQLVTVQGLPLRRAYETFLQANRVLWSERTNFQEGACGVMEAAYDLGYDVTKVKNAFAVVGIDLTRCKYFDFVETIAHDEVRKGVLVSKWRNPIFALEPCRSVQMYVTSKNGERVTVYVTSDAAGKNVVLVVNVPFRFDMTSDMKFYKLSTWIDSDISVNVHPQFWL